MKEDKHLTKRSGHGYLPKELFMKFPLFDRILWIVLLSFTVGILRAQETADFRKVRWGFNPKQVREAETVKPSSVKREKLVYTGVPLAERSVGLEYNFNGDSLLSASYYYYTTASVTKDDVMATAADFETRLKEKYGPGKASLLGDVRNTIWITPRTQINLSVGNVDRGWSVEVQYLCRVCAPGQKRNGSAKQETFKPRNDVPDF